MNWNLRLLVYTHSFAPKIGGVETLVMSLARRLADWKQPGGELAPNVTVVTSTPRGDFDDGLLPFRVVRHPALPELVRLILAADVVHLAGPAFLPTLFALLFCKQVVVEHHGFQTICPNGQLLHEPDQKPCPGHFMAGRHLKCIRCNVRLGRFRSFAMWLLTFPRRWLCQRVRWNITPTAWLATLLQLPRMCTIPHGIFGGNNVEHGPVSQPPALAFIGRLVSTKGVELLLQAAARVKSSRIDFVLRIIGDGPERSNLEEQVRALDLQDRVKFLGYLPDARLGEVLAGVAAIVTPALAGEVFGLVALETMMRGVLPIVPCGGALAEVVGDFGLCFSLGDAEALAGCLQRVLGSPLYAAAAGKRAREWAREHLNDRIMAERHFALYQNLAGKGLVEAEVSPRCEVL